MRALLTRAAEVFPQAQTITLSLEIDRATAPPAAVPPSRAGGLARARSAIRASDGTFLGAAVIAAVLDDAREALRPRRPARARRAQRDSRGRFI